MTPALRNKALARLHCAKRDLGLDDETYRAMLERLTGKTSAKLLDDAQLAQVLDHVSAELGVKSGPYQGKRPHNRDTKAPLRKIEAFLAEAGRGWEYANGLAKRMYDVERAEWCDDEQLRGLIAALYRDAKRRESRGGE